MIHKFEHQKHHLVVLLNRLLGPIATGSDLGEWRMAPESAFLRSSRVMLLLLLLLQSGDRIWRMTYLVLQMRKLRPTSGKHRVWPQTQVFHASSCTESAHLSRAPVGRVHLHPACFPFLPLWCLRQGMEAHSFHFQSQPP